MSWDIAALREMVATKFGEGQARLLTPCTKSIQDRFLFARYHFHEAQKLLKTHLGDDDGETAFMLEFGPPSDEQENYRQAKWQARAHVVACLQNIHALSDTMSHILCFAIGLNLGATTIRDRDISMSKVLGLLTPLKNCNVVVRRTNELLQLGDYRYLSDVVNHSKHRSLVEPIVTHYFEETAEGPWDLQLDAFCRGTRSYGKRSLTSFFRPEYERQSRLFVQIGCALNDALKGSRIV